jgi:N-acetylglucosamine-6-phosphate deacetylase
MIAIDGGSVFTPIRKFTPGRIIMDGGTIREIGAAENITIPPAAQRIDATGLMVAPGFIEPHIHGCGSVDLMDGSFEAVNAVSRLAARHGTTAFLPTTVSSAPETLTAAVERLGQSLKKSFDGATPLGIHMEGPFINPLKRGTHKPSNILAPDARLLEQWIHASDNSIRLVTLAPELEGVASVIDMAKRFSVTVAMGHSNATLEETAAAGDRGVCYAVHAFNAMRAMSHRDPGIAGAILADDRIFAEIIADGIHVDRAVVRTFARAKGKTRVILATDAISATDMPDGQYRLGSDFVTVANGVCRDSEKRLAGSTLTQEAALRNFVEWTGWSFEDAIFALTLNPAQALNIKRKGVLEPGSDADVVILDSRFHVVKTFVQGRLVWTN